MKLLIIDDEWPNLEVLKLSLGCEGYDVMIARSGEEGLKIFMEERPRLVLTDIKMPGIDGIEVLKRIKAIDPGAEVIIITGHGEMDTAVAALHYGASDFVTKPIQDKVLMSGLERAKKKIEMGEQPGICTKNLGQEE